VGQPSSILRELERRAEVIRVFPLRREPCYGRRRLTYRPDREPLMLKSIACQIERRVRSIRAHWLLAPGAGYGRARGLQNSIRCSGSSHRTTPYDNCNRNDLQPTLDPGEPRFEAFAPDVQPQAPALSSFEV
jgi:hypothetical protein